MEVYVDKGRLYLKVNEGRLQERSKFDGCYVWTTELGTDKASDQEIYERYKDLKYFEDDFRTFNTNFLEIMPIHVRTIESTRGHLFVTMLAHMIVMELRKDLLDMDITIEESLRVIGTICQNSIRYSDEVTIEMIPQPTNEATSILNALKIKSPKSIKEVQVNVVTRHSTRKSP